MNKTFFLITLLIVGFFYTVLTALKNHYTYAQVAWLFWICSLLFLPVLLTSHLGEYFLSLRSKIRLEKPQKKSKKRSNPSFFQSPVAFTVMMIIFTVISGVVTLLIGLFLAGLAPILPLDYFTIQGYAKNFDFDAAMLLITQYTALIPGFLCFQSSIFLKDQTDRLRGSGFITNGILILVIAGLSSVGGALLLKTPILLPYVPISQLIIFCLLLFLPWPLILGKDMQSKRYSREPELFIPPSIPVEYTYKAKNVAFWGWFTLMWGFFILFMTMGAGRLILTAHYSVAAKILIGFFLGFIAVAVASAFFFAGMNMLFGSKKFSISRETITFTEKGFIVFVPLTKTFKVPICEYSRIECLTTIWHSTKEPTWLIYSIVLKHQQNIKKDVAVYRAYHDGDYETIAEKWSQLLNLPCHKNESHI